MRKKAEVKQLKSQIAKKEKEISILKKRIENLEQGNPYDIGDKAKSIITAHSLCHKDKNEGEVVQ